MSRIIRIGSRESKLAMIQSNSVKDFIESRGCQAELVTMKTTGDKILEKTLDQIGGKGLFVKELDQALMDDRSDLSVHSLKDMPMQVPQDLPLIAFSAREDPRDVLVLPKGKTELDLSLPIGSSSFRRQIQVQKLFPEAKIEPVRGNVQTRLRKLDEGQYCALVLAAAGLIRLGLEDRISKFFSVEEILPAAGQGILAIQGRADETYEYLDDYGDAETTQEALAERAFVRWLDGGCSSPIAAHAECGGGQLTLEGLYYDDASGRWHRDQMSGQASDAEQIGVELAQRMKGVYE